MDLTDSKSQAIPSISCALNTTREERERCMIYPLLEKLKIGGLAAGPALCQVSDEAEIRIVASFGTLDGDLKAEIALVRLNCNCI